MDKERFNDALMGYLYGELTPPEEEVFLAHCRANPEAMAELNALGGLRKLTQKAAALADPPAAITARILDAGRQAVPSAGSAASQKIATGAGAKGAPGGFWAALSKPWAWGVAVAGAGATAVLLMGVPTLNKVAPMDRQEAAGPAPVVMAQPTASPPAPDGLEDMRDARPDMQLKAKARMDVAKSDRMRDVELDRGGGGDAPLAGGGAGLRQAQDRAQGRKGKANEDPGQGDLGAMKLAEVAAEPVAEKKREVEKKPAFAEADNRGGAGGKAWGVRASQDEAGAVAPKEEEAKQQEEAPKKVVSYKVAQTAPAKEAAAPSPDPSPADKSAAPAAPPPATPAGAQANERKNTMAPRPSGYAVSPLALPQRTAPLSKDAKKADDVASVESSVGSAGNTAAYPPPAAAAAPPPPGKAMASAPAPKPAEPAAPANKPMAVTRGPAVGGDSLADQDDALALPRAKRERAEMPEQRRAVVEEMKKMKKADSSMRAQSEMSAATDLLASGEPDRALDLFRRADGLDVSRELAPNPRVGQAVSLARLKKCNEALAMARGIARQYPAFSRLGGTLEEIATCYEKSNNATMASSLRKEAATLNTRLAKSADPATLAKRATAVNQQVRKDVRLVAGCEMAGTSAGELPAAAGSWTLTLTLNAAGEPTRVSARGPKPAPATQACLESLLRAQRFATADLPTQDVDVRLMLQARAAGGAAASKAKSRAQDAPAEAESLEAR